MVGGMSRDVEGLSGTFDFSAWKNCDIHLKSLDFEEPGPLHWVSVLPGKAWVMMVQGHLCFDNPCFESQISDRDLCSLFWVSQWGFGMTSIPRLWLAWRGTRATRRHSLTMLNYLWRKNVVCRLENWGQLWIPALALLSRLHERPGWSAAGKSPQIVLLLGRKGTGDQHHISCQQTWHAPIKRQPKSTCFSTSKETHKRMIVPVLSQASGNQHSRRRVCCWEGRGHCTRQ